MRWLTLAVGLAACTPGAPPALPEPLVTGVLVDISSDERFLATLRASATRELTLLDLASGGGVRVADAEGPLYDRLRSGMLDVCSRDGGVASLDARGGCRSPDEG